MERPEEIKRILKSEDTSLPAGYRMEGFADKLTTPINLTITDQGDILELSRRMVRF